MSEPKDHVWLTPAEAADYLRISTRTLRRLALPMAKLGARTVRYHRDDLDQYLARLRAA